MSLLSLPLILCLIIIGWKRRPIRVNAVQCGLPYSFAFRLRLYHHATLDLLRFFHGRYGSDLHIRASDSGKLRSLKTGPALFLTAHFHNWELMGAWLTSQGVPLLSGARLLSNPWSQSLLHHLRSRLRMKIVFADLPRRALRHLQSGRCFGFLWDQRSPRSQKSAVFFGQPLSVDALPLFLVRQSQAPVFFGALLPDGHVRLIQLSRSSQTPRSLDTLAQRYHRVLECLVRRHPTYWYGLTHRRFLESVDYASGSHVSRETSTPPGVMVSRETKVSN